MIDDCFFHDKNRLRHEDAIGILRSRLSPIASSALRALSEVSGRIVAEAILSPRDIPAFDNTAVDGYGFTHGDGGDGGWRCVDMRVAAGQVEKQPLSARSAVRIFTGASVPSGVDTVAMQEDCETKTNDGKTFVKVPEKLRKGANIRLAGEDVRTGDTIVSQGQYLRPQDIAAIASAGIANVTVYKPMKIALASTGEEIVRPGNKLKPGQVYDANQFMISSLLSTLPVEVSDIGILPDDRDMVDKTLEQAAHTHDIVITSGGASMGEEDHVTKLLAEKGKRHMWQLAIKPGRPMCFGQLHDSVFFGLPGNPVAGFICFLLYVRPAILRLCGAGWHEPRRYQIPCGFTFKNKKPDRREYWRGFVEQDNNGKHFLKKFNRDGSGLISGLQKADGLIEIKEETTHVMPGDMLDFIPFTEFGIS